MSDPLEASTGGQGDPHDELARAVGAAIGGDEGRGGHPNPGQVREVLRLARRSGSQAGGQAVRSGRWLAEVTLAAASHLPVRNLDTLRRHHDGRAGALLARPLIRNASLTSGAVGATTGALATASMTTPATWLTLPVQLAVETMIVVAVEMKLVGELHEAAGYPVAGNLRRNGPLIAKAWTETRGIATNDLAALARPGAAAAATSTASGLLGRSSRDRLTEQIRRRLIGRVGRNSATLIPMMVGSVAGEELNRRATRRLGRTVAQTLAIAPPRR